jgi:RPA family protein
MSADGGGREVAYRLFAAEYDDADYSYSESDEERAPNYVVTPTGARVNRLFVGGVLTEVESVSEDVLRARVADATGAFVLYAGQYQPDEQAFLESTAPPAFVAVTGKARTFQPEDSDRVFTSVRPESINEVDAETRDRWTVQAAEQTIERIGDAARALSTGLSGDELRAALREDGLDAGRAEGIAIALEHYGTTPAYLAALQDVALDAARVVAGERDEVRAFDRDPATPGDVTASDLVSDTADISEVARAQTDASGGTSASDGTADETAEPTAGTTETEPTDRTVETEPETSETTETTEPESEIVETESETSDAGAGAESAADPGDFDPEEFELEEETREEIEEEYGTDFQTGTEVDDPGEADIETPEPDKAAGEPTTAEGTTASETATDTEPDADETAAEATGEASAETSADTSAEIEGETADEETTADEEATDEETTADEESAAEEPDDPQEALLAVMEELDDGSGADREALVAEMESRYGMGPEAVEDAIQGALMDGQCYEPDETSLKPI